MSDGGNSVVSRIVSGGWEERTTTMKASTQNGFWVHFDTICIGEHDIPFIPQGEKRSTEVFHILCEEQRTMQAIERLSHDEQRPADQHSHQQPQQQALVEEAALGWENLMGEFSRRIDQVGDNTEGPSTAGKVGRYRGALVDHLYGSVLSWW